MTDMQRLSDLLEEVLEYLDARANVEIHYDEGGPHQVPNDAMALAQRIREERRTMARNTETADGVPVKRIAGRLWMQLDDAAAYAGMAPGTLRNWGAAGKIQIRRFGRHGHVAKDQLDEVLTGAA